MKHGHIYQVPFGTPLADRIGRYFTNCSAATQAVEQYVRQTLPLMGVGHVAEEDVIIEYSQDCDAGGLLAVSLPIDALRDVTLDPVLWETMPDSEDADRVRIYPRMERHTRFLRYAVAAAYIASGREDWEFLPPTEEQEKKGAVCQWVAFSDVERRLSSAERKALADKKGNAPTPRTHVVCGYHYMLHANESLPVQQADRRNVDPDRFRLSLGIYKAWTSLPYVPANLLAFILSLRMPDIKFVRRSDLAYCHWRKDEPHQRWLFHTGLVTDVPGVTLAEDDDAHLLFGEEEG